MKAAHTCVTVPISVMTNLASLTSRRTGSVGVPPGPPNSRPAHAERLQGPVLQPGHEPNKVKIINIENNVYRLTSVEKEVE